MALKHTPLDEGYTVEFDSFDCQKWHEIMDCFDDSNIYQTWSYDAVRCGEKNLSHFVLRLSDKIVAAGQARIAKMPFVGMGAAYIRWGPLWRLQKQTPDPAFFHMAIRAIRNEYVCRRGLILRIYPIAYDLYSNSLADSLITEGYKPTPGESPQRTLILDIQPSIEKIRRNLKQKWRNCLNKAEKNQLEITEGTEINLFDEFVSIYQELLQRKKFKEPNDINEFRAIQKQLPDKSKMGIFLCHSKGLISAGAICAAVGETGVYLFGATNDQGMKNKGSYLLQWKMIQWMKNQECRYYNLNGINPETNPGSHHFKAGVAGKTHKDVHYLGRFDCYPSVISSAIVFTATSMFPFVRNMLPNLRSLSTSKLKV